jgi:hypothetical protein
MQTIPEIQTYHALISSGSTYDTQDDWGNSDVWDTTLNDDWGIDLENATITNNTELEYSLKYGEWTKIYREDGSGARPLHVGLQVRSNRGKIYTYGLSDNGYMYRLEDGMTWDGTAIAQYVHTKNLLLDAEKPFLDHTTINYLRLIYTQKATTGEDITIAHYAEDTLSVDGTSNQSIPDAIDMGTDNYSTQDCVLGPALYHSIKLSADIDIVYDGMELIGMALYYDDHDTIFE